jgi:acyl-CoA reductase-like NAD-dependent aldehyde dehydrogenase
MQLAPGTTLRVRDVIHIRGHTTDFTQKVESLEVNHAPVTEVGPNDDFRLKVVEPRLFLHRDIFDNFLNTLGQKVKALKLGDPLDETSDIGTIINEKQFRKVCGYVEEGLKRREARLVIGGLPPKQGPLGLAAYVWSHDLGRALRAAHAIEAGWVQVNQGLGQSPGHSYGGYKESGIGREFSLEGMLESYTQRKNVTINLAH